MLGSKEWDAANRFAAANGLRVIIGVNGGPGPRNPDFTWNPDNARALLGRAAAIGLPPAVVSFGNEPNITVYGSSNPASYSAADYARDVRAFLAVKAEVARRSTFIGPGSFFTTGAERAIANAQLGPDTSAIMPLTGRLYDAVSYHHYPAFGNTAVCSGLQPRPPTDPLAAEFLDRVKGSLAYMRGLRDANAPRRPLWVDEFGNTACGGVVGYSNTLAASFYYLNALGTMARGGVHVATRWTIAGTQPYALLDDATLTPRPDYWAALLWKRLMGTTVLDPAVTNAPAGLRLYSSCTPGVRGGVTTLALNTDHAAPAAIHLRGPGARGASIHAVTGDLAGDRVALNGRPLEVTAAGELPSLSPTPVAHGDVTVAPASYAFITQPRAGAWACGAWRWPWVAQAALSQRFGFSTIIWSSCSPVIPPSLRVGITSSNSTVMLHFGTSFAFRYSCTSRGNQSSVEQKSCERNMRSTYPRSSRASVVALRRSMGRNRSSPYRSRPIQQPVSSSRSM